jgi:polyhydroxyalkanoate synthesis regulator phasin
MIEELLRNYVTPARLILDMHTENFDSPELLSLTLPMNYEQLTGAKDGRTALLVSKLNLQKLDMLKTVLNKLCNSENEVVSKMVSSGKINRDQAFRAAGKMERDVRDATKERHARKRYKYGNTNDDAIQIDDADEEWKLMAKEDNAPEDAEMEDAYERPTDRLYSSKKIKEENAVMQSADR